MRAHWLAERAPISTLVAYALGFLLVAAMTWMSWRWGWVDPDPFAPRGRVIGLRFSTFGLPLVAAGWTYQFLIAMGWVPALWWSVASDGRITIASALGRLGFKRMRLKVGTTDVVEFYATSERPIAGKELLRRDHVVIVSNGRHISLSSHGRLKAESAVSIHRELGGAAKELPLS